MAEFIKEQFDDELLEKSSIVREYYEKGRQEGRHQGRNSLLTIAESIADEQTLAELRNIENLSELEQRIMALLNSE